MKAIKAADIKAMVKKFNLNEEEEFALKLIAKEINVETDPNYNNFQLLLLNADCATIAGTAVKALLVYFGGKAQKGGCTRFRETTWAVAEVLKCGAYQVGQWLKGISYNKDRFGKHVECCTQFGQNYLEIA